MTTTRDRMVSMACRAMDKADLYRDLYRQGGDWRDHKTYSRWMTAAVRLFEAARKIDAREGWGHQEEDGCYDFLG